MPKFMIEGRSQIFANAKTFSFSEDAFEGVFVTPELHDEGELVIRPVDRGELQAFEGQLFLLCKARRGDVESECQIDGRFEDEEESSEDETVLVFREVRLQFWPWEDNEEFEDMESPDDGSENT